MSEHVKIGQNKNPFSKVSCSILTFGRKPCKIDVFQLSVFAAKAKKKLTIKVPRLTVTGRGV